MTGAPGTPFRARAWLANRARPMPGPQGAGLGRRTARWATTEVVRLPALALCRPCLCGTQIRALGLELWGGFSMPQLNAQQVRLDFPLFSDPQGDPQLVYLDNAATTQKPRAVLDCLHETYAYRNANVHRGLYPLAVEATERYEAARAGVARVIGAAEPRSIIFTRNTTEAINLVAYAWARRELKA